MNRNRYRLVFNASSGMMTPVAETARRQGKSAAGGALALAGALLAGTAGAELPVASSGVGIPAFVTQGQAAYQVNGTQAVINQVGSTSILNWQSFNVSAGHDVQFRQVDSLTTNNLVQGASFTSLNRIWDINPSVIAGSISQAAGQQANIILVNSNGIAFMGGSQVNLNQFTASTLNLADAYVGNLTGTITTPQFEKALDGTEARGFIKVMPDARISATDSGRVMLIAPTVVNEGTVQAADGQIIVAAATRVYLTASTNNNLRGLLIEVESPTGLASFDAANTSVKDGQLDGQTVSLTDAASDKLGHATNLGELSAERGNVTMVGYAVNQQGIARATTSVVANGSIYLMAKDTFSQPGNSSTSSARTGQVTLGAGSVTEITPEVEDSATTQDTVTNGVANAGLDQPSRVLILGQDVHIEGSTTDGEGGTTAGALIRAQSGQVDVYAIEASSSIPVSSLVSVFSNQASASGLFQADRAVSSQARLYLGDGALIDVSGLEGVEVSVARNTQAVELRGDELKDSPVNRDGPIRNETVYVDVERALAQADSGESTLIAVDRLESLQAQQNRTVAERSTQGGTIGLYSQGEAIIEAGVSLDVSGGSLDYTADNVKTTLLTSGGSIVDISDANAETFYDGIATQYVIDYGRWNRQETIDLGQSYRYDSGYVEGKDAGAVSLFGMSATVLGGSDTVVGRTVTGERQREAGIAPRGARLTLGFDDVSDADINASANGYQDFKLNQTVVVASGGSGLPEGFTFGDALAQDLKETLVLDPGLVGEGRVAELAIYSNQAAEVRDALAAPVAGKVTIAAADVKIAADVEAAAIDVAARYTLGASASLPVSPSVEIADGVTLRANGQWVNDLPGMGSGAATAQIDGGTLRVVAETLANGVDSYLAQGKVVLGEGVSLEADGGGWLRADGTLAGGDGGAIHVQGYFVEGWGGVEAHAYGLDDGGSLTLGANRVQVGGTPLAAGDAIDLDAGFFTRGGFADYTLSTFTSLDVADDTQIAPTVSHRELATTDSLRASGTPVDTLGSLVVRDARVRQPVNVTLVSALPDAQIGQVRIGEGARIASGPGATITLDAYNLLDIQGTLASAGGSIAATADDNVGVVWLGESALLDVAGQAVTYTDSQGLVQGEVLAGGQVNLAAGDVVTRLGSRIDLSGAAPVHLDILDAAGGLGREVGSDAGSLTVFANSTAAFDGDIAAHGGGADNRGGVLDFTLGIFTEPSPGQSLLPAVLRLAESVPEQTGGLVPGDALAGVETKLAADTLEAAGFDRIRLSSRDAILLEDGLTFGAGRETALREIRLDAASIQTDGGDAQLVAETVQLGNYFPGRRAATVASTSTGTLSVEAKQLELAGTLSLEGMARAELTGTEEIRLAGVSLGNAQPVGELTAAADLVFHSAVVAPTSYSLYTIDAAGQQVAFTQAAGDAIQPWSALGSLTVIAQDIEQAGTIWAPFGTIDLQASDTLILESGSLTSVAASEGSVIAFGKIENGRDWVFEVVEGAVDNLDIADLGDKAIRVQGETIDMRAGAQVDLSGGGDLQAYEFTVGPGGSADILAQPDTYAIVPGYAGGYAAADAQEASDRAPGEAVYLSGVPGLADGTYTLLPAHYALLPGAYAVKLDSGVGEVLPGQAYSRQDGVRIAAGYLTDTRDGAPRDALWQGVQVLTRDQVLARSEFTLTLASDFFAASDSLLPQDAGLLSINTTGTGAAALALDAVYDLAAAGDGQGARVDISALNLAIVSGTNMADDPDAVVLDVGALNALGADSLFIGGTRDPQGETTVLNVGAETVTLANDATQALVASEVMLAANDTVTLKAGSKIDAQGDAGDAGSYVAAGNGAFVRAASTQAVFTRSGSPDRSQGTLIGEAGSLIVAADSVVLDATRENAYKGSVAFLDADDPAGDVAGNLAVGASRINFGAAAVDAEGLTYTQADLDALDLAGLTLTSYSTFDLYGDVAVGRLDTAGKPVLNALTLQGAGLIGYYNAGKTAQLNARSLILANAAGVAVSAATDADGNALPQGDGALAITADTLTLGEGDKRIAGFGDVSVTANELIGSGQGVLDVASAATLTVARISGGEAADQALNAEGALQVLQLAADRELAAVTALGAHWALAGTSVSFDGKAELPSGSFTLAASTGDVNVGSQARIDVAGRGVAFFDVEKPSWGGTVELVSDHGDVVIAAPAALDAGGNPVASVDVSAAAGGDAGKLVVRAGEGTFSAAAGSLDGMASENADGERGEGARVDIDVGALADFSALNAALNGGGAGNFDGERSLRVRSGDVSIAASETVRAQNLLIAVDDGTLDVAGTLDASAADAGRIGLYAGGDVNVSATATLLAVSGDAGADGGDIEIGSRDGVIDLAGGSAIDVAGGADGRGGTLLLRATRTATGVNVTALQSEGLDTARTVSVEAVKVYEGVSTLDTSSTNAGGVLGLAAIQADNTAFAALHDDIQSELGLSGLHVLSGVEVRAPGDLTLSTDWNLKDLRNNGEAGVLTLLATGDLKVNANLSDGFSHATACTTTTCSTTSPSPATLLTDAKSWSYRLVGGADATAADPMATSRATAGQGDVELAAGKLIRTGTGDIRVAAGGNIELKSNQSVIYTAGRIADPVSGFTTPATPLRANFTQDGGDVALVAQGDIVGVASTQLFSQWLYRQGALNATTGLYNEQPAWWVRFDQFQQGVGALGGGDVTLVAGGKVENVSASAPTQGRTAGTSPATAVATTTGGGTVRIEAGGDVLGGTYLAGRGEILVRAGGRFGAVSDDGLQPVIALGDARADVRATGDVEVGNAVTPQMLPQAALNLITAFPSLQRPVRSLYSTYSAASELVLGSLTGDTSIRQDQSRFDSINTGWTAPNLKQYLLPASLVMTSFQGDIDIGQANEGNTLLTMTPSASGTIELLASDDIRFHSSLTLSDMDPALVPNAVKPSIAFTSLIQDDPNIPRLIVDPLNPAKTPNLHATTPVHTGDTEPVRVYAVGGDVTGINNDNANLTVLSSSKRLELLAGGNVSDLSLHIQHLDAADVSRVEAGESVVFSSTPERRDSAQIRIGGPGRLEVTAGGDIDLGTSGGIVSRGRLDNLALPAGGADLRLAAGVGAAGVDYLGTVDRLISSLQTDPADDTTLWLARWLTGDDSLTESNALDAVLAIDAMDEAAQKERVVDMLYTALRTTGRDSLLQESDYAADYTRGYAALELVFPGSGELNDDGSSAHYEGDIDLFASRIKTEQGGSIQFMAPGGDVIVGLANTPSDLIEKGINGLPPDVLGIVVAGEGDIQGFVYDDVLVNQSRILTVGGGDVLLWSSEGDIDAGKGKKSAVTVPPPVLEFDEATGLATLRLQGAVSGSGIGALEPAGGPPCGTTNCVVDLIAPKGTVNAGDAGIRAGNLNIAAQVVLGADNISVSGTSTGTPVADTSAVTAASSGASNAGGDVSATTAALAQNLAEAARTAEELKKAFRPTFISAEVVGHGE